MLTEFVYTFLLEMVQLLFRHLCSFTHSDTFGQGEVGFLKQPFVDVLIVDSTNDPVPYEVILKSPIFTGAGELPQ